MQQLEEKEEDHERLSSSSLLLLSSNQEDDDNSTDSALDDLLGSSQLGDWTIHQLLRDPRTEELESVQHLVKNCQQRVAYCADLKKRNGGVEKKELDDNTLEEDDEVVNVPPPGVPSNYLGVHPLQ